MQMNNFLALSKRIAALCKYFINLILMPAEGYHRNATNCSKYGACIYAFVFFFAAAVNSQSLIPNKRFGNNGAVTTNLGYDNYVNIFDAAVFPDNKFIAAGYPSVKFLASGVPDSSISGSGILNLYRQDYPIAVAAQADGKAIFVYSDGFSPIVTLVRVNGDGKIDSSYGKNGVTAIGLDSSGVGIFKCVIAADNKLLLFGQTNAIDKLVLARVLPSGVADSSFNATGVVTFREGTGYRWSAGAVAVQSTGKIVIAGMRSTESTYAVLHVFRFNANGSRDNSFNGTGSFTYSTTPSGGEVGQDICIQPDDKILLGGSSNGRIMLIRLAANGSPDNSFNGNGIQTIASYGAGAQVLLRSNGKILVAGTAAVSIDSPWHYSLAQFTANGALDAGFGNAGIRIIAASGYDREAGAILQPDGSVILIGYGSPLELYTLIKINSSGNPDNSFGSGGVKLLQLWGTDESMSALLVQPDKKIIAAGRKRQSVFHPGSNAMVRYKSDGKTLDSTFGTAGKVLDFDGKEVYFQSMARQSTGKIIVSSVYYSFDSFTLNKNVIFRLNANGSVDNSFGAGSQYVMPPYPWGTRPADIRTLSNDQIIVCQNLMPEEGGNIILTRLSVDGVPDASFGVNGSVTLNTPVPNLYANTVELQPDGKILLSAEHNLGDSITQYVLLRLLSNGSLDNSFDGDGIKELPVQGYLYAGIFDVKAMNNGKIVVATTRYDDGFEAYTPTIFRMNSDGTPDLGFNNSGSVLLQGFPGYTDIDLAAMALHPDSSIYLSGWAYATDSGTTFLLHINSNGAIDTTVDYANNGFLRLRDDFFQISAFAASQDSTILLGTGVFQPQLPQNGEDFILTNFRKVTHAYRFIGNGNWSNAANWEAGKTPPAILPPDSYIYIQPAAGGQCVLDVAQHISADDNVIVAAGKKMIITGSLVINQ